MEVLVELLWRCGRMKGFIYLIEIAVAAILMTIVLTVFFSIRVKQDWEKPDLIAAGNNILNSMRNKNDFIFNILSENLDDIENNKPANVRYGLEVSGSPKSKISIGCYVNCFYFEELLKPEYNYGSIFLNGRWINFTFDTFDMNVEIPQHDVIVLINYTNYSHPAIKSRIDDYLRNGGVLIGINATINGTDTNFNNIFNLTYVSGVSSNKVNFTFYNPSQDEIAKYFLGIGMDAYRYWHIWDEEWIIDYWGTNKINITDSSDSAINRTNLVEGSIFNLTSPIDGIKYFFKVKKLWPERVDFQILNKTFVFNDFSEQNVTGKNILGYNNYAALTTNNSVIWISNFPSSDEYKTLLKAIILSKVNTWTAKGVFTQRPKTTLSSFVPLCCDMPETAELYLTLWYEI
jgi:hypothetical protein